MNHNLVFTNNEEIIGSLIWENGYINFEGNASDSAKKLFHLLNQQFFNLSSDEIDFIVELAVNLKATNPTALMNVMESGVEQVAETLDEIAKGNR